MEDVLLGDAGGFPRATRQASWEEFRHRAATPDVDGKAFETTKPEQKDAIGDFRPDAPDLEQAFADDGRFLLGEDAFVERAV